MRRLLLATIIAALAATGLAAWSIAAPSGTHREARKAAQVRLPALPAAVKSRKRWLIGVKCDYPPFGAVTASNRHAGYDVDVAYRFAELAFGKRSRVSFTCVTTPSRIPTLTTGKVDIIISTLTYTKARAETINYSIPYYAATGRLLVRNDTRFGSLRSALDNKTIATTRGSIYDRWVKNCFKDSSLLVFDSPSLAVLALKDHRAETFMFDDAFLLNVVANESSLRLTTHKFLAIPWGIGIRKGEPDMLNWVNAAIRAMRAKDEFAKILRHNAPKNLAKTFLGNVPRPKQRFAYPTGSTPPENKCP